MKKNEKLDSLRHSAAHLLAQAVLELYPGTKMTIGLDIGMKVMKIDENEITLQIWDFAGEKRFRFFLPSYSLGASGGIFMFDITRPSSLHDIEEWLTVFNPDPNNPSKKTPILMVGGKSDLDSLSIEFPKGEGRR